ncbi:disease resistance protein rga2 [Quercus suber]|uniref:Disease resistance protein rga2 n=1 Tax=Quercus suber TaxID=58331 RepID=A0AAW0IXS6_QUESU
MDALEYISKDILRKAAGSSKTTFFPSLSSLIMYECPNLKGWWRKVDESPSTAGTASTFSSLEEVNNLESLLEEKCVQNLISLKKLSIYNCNGLKSLPCNGIQHLTSLQEMEIMYCNELALLNDENDGMQWQGLKSLRFLHLERIPNLVSLPNGLQHVTTLKYLQIINCPNLMALPG